jgi:hypothetical protein
VYEQIKLNVALTVNLLLVEYGKMKNFPLLGAFARERLVKAQQAGKCLAVAL